MEQRRARWYDPAIGRFVGEDPNGVGEGNDPNLYRYVGNSPANRTDPTGLRQAGNPLDNLFGALGGGYVGGAVKPAKPISPFLASSNVPVNTGGLLGVPKLGIPQQSFQVQVSPDFVRQSLSSFNTPGYNDSFDAAVRRGVPRSSTTSTGASVVRAASNRGRICSRNQR